MTLKDIVGMVFIGAGATVATVGYRLLGMQWFLGAVVLLGIGLGFIWSAARDRKIRDALDEVPGDWGDRHFISGEHSTDVIAGEADQ